LLGAAGPGATAAGSGLIPTSYWPGQSTRTGTPHHESSGTGHCNGSCTGCSSNTTLALTTPHSTPAKGAAGPLALSPPPSGGRAGGGEVALRAARRYHGGRPCPRPHTDILQVHVKTHAKCGRPSSHNPAPSRAEVLGPHGSALIKHFATHFANAEASIFKGKAVHRPTYD
jgi:hypothetical protein